MKLRDFIRYTPKQPPWVLPRVFPGQGYSVLVGTSKGGKSIFSLQMLHALQHQERFLCFDPPSEPKTGLYVEGDASEVDVHEQVKNRSYVFKDSEAHIFIPKTRWVLDHEPGEILEYIRGPMGGRCDFIIWATVFSLAMVELNEVKGVRQLLTYMYAVHPGPHLLLHHPRKDEEEWAETSYHELWKTAYGHNSLIGGSSQTLYLFRANERLAMTGRNVRSKDQHIPLTWVNHPETGDRENGIWGYGSDEPITPQHLATRQVCT